MAKKTRKFKTEVQQLLDLVVHSLYSKKEIFLRELISNASDAMDRARFDALTDKAIQADGDDWKIEIIPDKDAGTLTIRDNGIGMNLEELEKNIGTIASSGTKKYLEALQASGEKKASPELIGQFGVGFYSAFMVSDRVDVLTRRSGSDHAILWSSKGEGNYTLDETERDGRGTDVILHLSEDQQEFLEEWQIRRLIKEYSDYIEYPIVMDITRSEAAAEEGKEAVETTESETLNSRVAIWRKSKSDISEEEYKEFYKHISHDYTDPLQTIHYVAEGTTEFYALVFIPSTAPFDLHMREHRGGVHLYVKNVFITDECKELFPEYLRFVRGVVDSSDLPLNVSREMLQDDAVIRRIGKSLAGRVLKDLGELKATDMDGYLKFYKEFGPVLKEGIYLDFENQDKLKDLLLFESTKSEDGKPVTLREYVDRMPESQKDIYFLAGESTEAVKNSPLLGYFREKDYEVLLLTDVVDAWVTQRLTEYDGKSMKAIDRADVDTGTDEEKEEREKKKEEAVKEYGDLLEFIQEKLKEEVKEVRMSDRLTDSACCLVAGDAGLDANMERIMRAMNQDVPATQRIMELNPSHPVLDKMRALFAEDRAGDKLSDYVELLYAQALLTEGSTPRNPLRFSQLVSDLMVAAE